MRQRDSDTARLATQRRLDELRGPFDPPAEIRGYRCFCRYSRKARSRGTAYFAVTPDWVCEVLSKSTERRSTSWHLALEVLRLPLLPVFQCASSARYERREKRDHRRAVRRQLGQRLEQTGSGCKPID